MWANGTFLFLLHLIGNFYHFVVRFLISNAAVSHKHCPLLWTPSPQKNHMEFTMWTDHEPKLKGFHYNSSHLHSNPKLRYIQQRAWGASERFKCHKPPWHSRFAHSLTARSVRRKFSRLGTRRSISSVTLLPARQKVKHRSSQQQAQVRCSYTGSTAYSLWFKSRKTALDYLLCIQLLIAQNLQHHFR